MNSDSFQEIWFSLTRHKLRTSLTAFGVFWGIFMLVMLLGGGAGVKHGLEKSFSGDLRNSLWIMPAKTSVPFKGLALNRDVQFTESDLAAIRREIPSVDLISAENPMAQFGSQGIQITYGNQSGTFGVFGVAKDYFKIKVYQDYLSGRRLNDLDENEQRKVATIGVRVSERFFESPQAAIGKQLSINGVNFAVVGVFYDGGWQGKMSEMIYIPMNTCQSAFGQGENISLITVTPRENASGDDVNEAIVNLLKQRHNIAPSDRRAIRVQDLAKETAEVTDTFTAVSLFIWFVGMGTLMAGVVGISNIMIITVKERTMEIGIRKALGAKPINIVATILLEALLVTLIAGYAGLVLAVGFIELINFGMTFFNINFTYFVNPQVNFNAALSSLGIIVTSGMIAGFIPAWKAAKISPIEAMRAQ